MAASPGCRQPPKSWAWSLRSGRGGDHASRRRTNKAPFSIRKDGCPLFLLPLFLPTSEKYAVPFSALPLFFLLGAIPFSFPPTSTSLFLIRLLVGAL